MQAPNNKQKTFSFSDFLFICSLFLVVICTAYVGVLSYEEGMKVEESKANGEAFAAWMSQASAKRMDADFEMGQCGGPNTVVATLPSDNQTIGNDKSLSEGETEITQDKTTATDASSASTATPNNTEVAAKDSAKSENQSPTKNTKSWGDCLKALTSANGPLAELKNPFTLGPLLFANKCDPTDAGLAGALVFNKISPTPPGSPSPTFLEDFQEGDSIEQKLQISVTICDKGSYPIHVADIEF